MAIRRVTTGSELSEFKRVHTFEGVPEGQFVVRSKDIAHLGNDAEKIRVYLGLKDKPKYISDVTIPKDVNLEVGPIGKQPNFGRDNTDGFQYRFSDRPDPQWFSNPEKLK